MTAQVINGNNCWFSLALNLIEDQLNNYDQPGFSATLNNRGRVGGGGDRGMERKLPIKTCV